MIKNSRLITVAAIILTAMLSGCPNQDDSSASEELSLPYEGVQLQVVVPADLDISETWAPAVNDWADENAAEVNVSTFDFTAGDGLEELLAQSPTLVLLPTPLVNELVADKHVATIPVETLESGRLAWHQLSPGVRTTLGTLSGEPALLPVTCPVPVLAYRRDLLEAAGLEPPRTWDEYGGLVEKLSEWAPGHIAVEPWSDDSLATVFLTRAVSGAKHPAQYSVELDVTTGEPLIATEPFVQALSEMAGLQKHLLPDVRAMSADDCLAAFVEGRAAIGLIWDQPPASGDADASAESRETQAGSSVAFNSVPGRDLVYDRDTGDWVSSPANSVNRPALIGFAGLTACVPDTASSIEQLAAWDLWGLLEAYQLEGTIPAVDGSLLHGISGASVLSGQLAPPAVRSYQDAVTDSLQSNSLVCALPVPERERLLNQLRVAIVDVLEEKADPAEALRAAEDAWTKAIDDIGHTRVLNGYRQRLGLSPVIE